MIFRFIKECAKSRVWPWSVGGRNVWKHLHKPDSVLVRIVLEYKGRTYTILPRFGEGRDRALSALQNASTDAEGTIKWLTREDGKGWL